MEGPVTTDEATWIARARSGDAAAFEALLSRYERQIYAYIYRMMGGNASVVHEGGRYGSRLGFIPIGADNAARIGIVAARHSATRRTFTLHPARVRC